MEESNRPASSNPVAEEPGSFELTRSDSDAASSLSAENSGDILHPSVNGRPVDCMAWTDEKHNKYLDSLEASFVQQLHRSRGLLAWSKEHNGSNKDLPCRLPAGVHKASEKFAVLQDGGWEKIIFENDQPLSAIRIPWTHCRGLAGKVSPLVSADWKDCNEFYHEKEQLKRKRFISKEPVRLEGNASKSPCYRNLVGSNQEGSGQNFVNEDFEECSNVIYLARRLKTAVEDS